MCRKIEFLQESRKKCIKRVHFLIKPMKLELGFVISKAYFYYCFFFHTSTMVSYILLRINDILIVNCLLISLFHGWFDKICVLQVF